MPAYTNTACVRTHTHTHLSLSQLWLVGYNIHHMFDQTLIITYGQIHHTRLCAHTRNRMCSGANDRPVDEVTKILQYHPSPQAWQELSSLYTVAEFKQNPWYTLFYCTTNRLTLGGPPVHIHTPGPITDGHGTALAAPPPPPPPPACKQTTLFLSFEPNLQDLTSDLHSADGQEGKIAWLQSQRHTSVTDNLAQEMMSGGRTASVASIRLYRKAKKKFFFKPLLLFKQALQLYAYARAPASQRTARILWIHDTMSSWELKASNAGEAVPLFKEHSKPLSPRPPPPRHYGVEPRRYLVSTAAVPFTLQRQGEKTKDSLALNSLWSPLAI